MYQKPMNGSQGASWSNQGKTPDAATPPTRGAACCTRDLGPQTDMASVTERTLCPNITICANPC